MGRPYCQNTDRSADAESEEPENIESGGISIAQAKCGQALLEMGVIGPCTRFTRLSDGQKSSAYMLLLKIGCDNLKLFEVEPWNNLALNLRLALIRPYRPDCPTY